MEPAAISLFTAWESFYVIIGSSAAALTGLQFVVIALGAESRTARGPDVKAYGTPTVVHFCAVLLISATLSMPWHAIGSGGVALGACGVAGLVYTMIVVRRVRGRTTYAPVLEDWVWHVILPLIAYATLLLAAIALERDPSRCLFVIAVTALLLLFVGIHNAWDAVTYIASEHLRGPNDPPGTQ